MAGFIDTSIGKETDPKSGARPPFCATPNPLGLALRSCIGPADLYEGVRGYEP